MTTALIVIGVVISVLVLAGRKDAKRQHTSFYKSRDKVNHFHYQEYKYETFRLGGYTVYNSIFSTTIFSLSQ